MNPDTRTHNSGEFLFDPDFLKRLDWASVKGYLSPPITNEAPGEEWLQVRPLQLEDFDKGYLQILTQLTAVGNVSRADFERQFRQMQQSGGYFVIVIEDTRNKSIIGTITLLTEFKFIHNCALKGRLEDLVINNLYRGKQLGKLLMITATLLAKELGCYKSSLDCKDLLAPYYTSVGYKLEPANASHMVMRFEEAPRIEDASSQPTANSSDVRFKL